MKVLVIGGTGTVGSMVVRELLARGADVHVLTRDPEKANLPEGAQAVEGNLLDPETVTTVFEGMDSVFLLNAVSTTEAHEGLMGVNGARLGNVGRIVYMSVHHADAAPHLPHFGAKLPVETAVKASGIPYTILRPNNFYQNDAWFNQAIQEYGIYPQPLGEAGVSRVDVRDIAEAAAVALTEGGHEGETYNLVGPEQQTGPRAAELWSEALGKPVNYMGNDLDAWEKMFLQYMPAWMVFDFKHMYGHFQEHGLKATQDDIDRQTALIGHAPRKYEDYVRETAEEWAA